MHGIGNDFVILDARQSPISLKEKDARHIADRHRGVGCDQIIIMEEASAADIRMRIVNADGSESGNCGNAARCVASLLLAGLEKDEVSIAITDGTLTARKKGALIEVDMGEPKLEWKEIPVSHECDTLHLNIGAGQLHDPVGVSMGNPHAVFFVEDVDAVDLHHAGPMLEDHSMFPERANIGVAEVVDRKTIKLRVWERGAGETQACGSGACAALVAAVRRELTDREAVIQLPGGELTITWDKAGSVLMAGEVALSFYGELLA